ncbi:MAG: hypothetical protein RJB01_1456, partial [Actinomycetota bacterium]
MNRFALEPDLAAAVTFQQVSLSVPQTKRRQGGGRKQRLRRLAGEVRREDLPVLVEVNASVDRGESVLVLGGRPVHRRALIRLIGGTMIPDSGTVRRGLPFLPMVDIGRALGRSFTVRQNIYLLGGLFGMTPDEVMTKVDAIAERAGLTARLDKHLSGAPALVRQKLAWSIAMATNARAFAIDEVIAVGDPIFKDKCWEHVAAAQASGTTFVVATDAPRALNNVFDRVLFIDPECQVRSMGVEEGIAAMREARRMMRD